MEKKSLLKYLKLGYTIKYIANECDRSETSVRYWIRKYGLKATSIDHGKLKFLERVKECVPKCHSYSQLCRMLGIPNAGNSYQNLKRLLVKYELNIDHFDGRPRYYKYVKLNPSDILIYDRCNGRREKTANLRMALVGSGVDTGTCGRCGLNSWLGGDIIMHIDHIDGNRLNNVIENLRILCPNCHNQITYINET